MFLNSCVGIFKRLLLQLKIELILGKPLKVTHLSSYVKDLLLPGYLPRTLLPLKEYYLIKPVAIKPSVQIRSWSNCLALQNYQRCKIHSNKHLDKFNKISA